MNIKFDLNKNWEFSLQSKSKILKENKWFKAEVPGTIYHNLLKEKLIDDPFTGDNELRLQWAAESDWSYQASFENPRVFRPDSPVLLVFEGLDSVAEVILNDRIIGSPDNMFRRWEYDVTSLLKKKNILRLNFISPYKYAKSQEAKYGKLPVALNSERVYIRKAQYSFGWDWGPSFADIGIWKSVFLVQNEDTYIKDFSFSTLNINKSDAEVEVLIRLNKSLDSSLNLMISVSDEKGTINFPVAGKNGTQIKEVFQIQNPILWWPNGEGEQHLYSVSVKLKKEEKVVDEVIKKTGIRKIKLHLKEKDANTFHFTVNGKKDIRQRCKLDSC